MAALSPNVTTPIRSAVPRMSDRNDMISSARLSDPSGMERDRSTRTTTSVPCRCIRICGAASASTPSRINAPRNTPVTPRRRHSRHAGYSSGSNKSSISG